MTPENLAAFFLCSLDADLQLKSERSTYRNGYRNFHSVVGPASLMIEENSSEPTEFEEEK